MCLVNADRELIPVGFVVTADALLLCFLVCWTVDLLTVRFWLSLLCDLFLHLCSDQRSVHEYVVELLAMLCWAQYVAFVVVFSLKRTC